jgi:antitoxin (DNA-binding transcriptional repressor) of toxin-antitoxin stability system
VPNGQPEPTVITVSEFRAQLPTLLSRVQLLNEKFMITVHGKPFAIMGPAPDKEDPPAPPRPQPTTSFKSGRK